MRTVSKPASGFRHRLYREPEPVLQGRQAIEVSQSSCGFMAEGFRREGPISAVSASILQEHMSSLLPAFRPLVTLISRLLVLKYLLNMTGTLVLTNTSLQGSTDQIPSNWVQRSQKHIVISLQYRVNIFGFPNSAGINSTSALNPGLLDQRLGLEWVRENAAAFGGDASRISLWGQSAGAESVDFYNFAYPSDPIVAGLIQDSGTALLPQGTQDPVRSNFSFVARHVGCGNLNAGSELACMQKVPFQTIESFLKGYSDNGTQPGISFSPVVDNNTIFVNYTARALAGNFTKKVSAAISRMDISSAKVLWYSVFGRDTLTQLDSLQYSAIMPMRVARWCPSTQAVQTSLLLGSSHWILSSVPPTSQREIDTWLVQRHIGISMLETSATLHHGLGKVHTTPASFH